VGLPLQLTGRQVAERVRDFMLTLIGGVQVDQRGTRAAMTHARHQLGKVRPWLHDPKAAGPANAPKDSAAIEEDGQD